MTRIVTALCKNSALALILVAGLLYLPLSEAQTQVNRRAWIEGTYSKLPYLLQVLITSDLIKDPEVIGFLKQIVSFYNRDYKPPLQFVDSPDKFIINPGETPRLMRSPEGIHEPIFINQRRFESPDLELDLPQLIKLFLHELGHKTKLADVDARDRWSQTVETLFREFYSSTDYHSGQRIEVLSLSESTLQVPPKSDQPYMVRPTFLIFDHQTNQTFDLTDLILQETSVHSMMLRNITSIINVFLPQTTDFLMEQLAKVSPYLDQFVSLFATALGAKKPEMSFTDSINQVDGHYQYLSVFSTKQVTIYRNILLVDGQLTFFTNHSKKLTVRLNGLPSAQYQTQPVQIMVQLANVKSPQPRVQMRVMLPMDLERQAKVKSVQRSNGKILTLDVEVAQKHQPNSIDLVMNYEKGDIRLAANRIRQKAGGIYVAHFEFDQPKANLALLSYSVVIDEKLILPLDREIEFQPTEPEVAVDSTSTKRQQPLNVLRETIGIRGYAGQREALRTFFDPYQPPINFYPVLNTEDILVLPPQGFWVEFDVDARIPIVDVELYVGILQFILDIRTADKDGKSGQLSETITVNEIRNGQAQDVLYASGGTVVEHQEFSMALSLPVDQMRISKSERFGFQKIRLPAKLTIPHIRELRESYEAHRPPLIYPHSLKITAADGRVYVHDFPSNQRPDEVVKHTFRPSAKNSPQPEPVQCNQIFGGI